MPFEKFYCAGTTPACSYACHYLSEAGFPIADSPDWNTKHLLLDVPSFPPGSWTTKSLDTLLSSLPENITVWGGNLSHPSLESFQTIDLLNNESYLTKNADITADCTIPIAESALDRPWHEVKALIIGWGRITKSLSRKLKNLGCDINISSSSASHREEAIASEFYTTASPDHIQPYHLIVNTAPADVLSVQEPCSSVLIDLASKKGIKGNRVIWARGLPGKYAPERSGKLIADTILRLSREEF